MGDSGPPTQPDHAIMTWPAARGFRILQLTDFHNDVSDDLTRRTYRDVRALVAHVRPDLLAVTGDIWCGDDKPELAPYFIERDLAFLGSLETPWAFAWGNHDYIGDFRETRSRIARTPHAVAPSGDGRGNFRVEIRGPDGRRPAWDVFFLNSHAECLLPEDVVWLEDEARRLQTCRGTATPALAFFHIPLMQYETARLAGRFRGIALEEVLYWGDDGTRFEGIRRAGNVRACFVGHNHLNDFYLEEEGVTLACGRATGHGGYGGDRVRKGAKAIELDATGAGLRFQTVFPDGTVWSP